MEFGSVAEASTKVLAGIGGFLGGTSMLVYLPAKCWRDAVRRVFVGVMASVMLSATVSNYMFNDKYDSEELMSVAFGIGFAAWFLLGAIAKFFEKRQEMDIVQMAKDTKEVQPRKRYDPYAYQQDYPPQPYMGNQKTEEFDDGTTANH